MVSSRGWLITTAAAAVTLSFIASADAAQLTGTVVSAGNDPRPIRGASVVLRRVESGKWVYTGPVQTDDKGHFSIDGGNEPANTTRGSKVQLLLSVYAPGCGLAGQFVTFGSDTVIRLSPEVRIKGSVLDSSGKPVAGATLQLSAELGPPGPRYQILRVPPALEKFLQATSGADGRWQLGGIALTASDFYGDHAMVPMATARVTVSGHQLVESMRSVPIDNPKDVNFVARIGGAITGRVLDDAGKPQVGVMIVAQTGEPQVSSESGQSDSSYATANAAADGTFQLSGLPKGNYAVAAKAADDTTEAPSLVAAAATGIAVVEGQKTALTSPIVMKSGAIVQGVVVSKTTGKPIPGVDFYVTGPQYPRVPFDRWSNGEQTDAEGRFTLRLSAGDNEIHVSNTVPGFTQFDPAIALSLREGETRTLPPIQVPAAVHVTLKVTDESGKPVADLPLLLQEPNRGGYRMEEAARTDNQGVWDSSNEGWPEPSAEETHAMQITVPSGWEVISPKSLALPADAPVAVVVRKADLSTHPRGRAVTPDGKPIAGAYVNVISYFKDGDDQRDYENENVTTDASGQFLLSPLRPGVTAQISIGKNDYRRAPGTPFDSLVYQPADGKQPDFGDVVLVPLTGSLSGSVVDAAKKPVAHAWLWSLDGDQRTMARTDLQGRFTIEHLPASGPITLHAAHGLLKANYDATLGKIAIVQLPAALSSRDVTIAARNRRRGLALLSELAHEAAPGQGARRDQTGGDSLADMLASLGEIDMAVHVGSSPAGTLDEEVLSGIVENGAQANPLAARELFLAQRDTLTSSERIFFRNNDMAMAFAGSDPAFANGCYHIAAKMLGDVIPADSYWHLATITKTAYRLNAPDEDAWAQKAIAAISKMMNGDNGAATAAVAELASRGDGVRAAGLLANLPVDKRSAVAAQILLRTAEQQPLESKKFFNGWLADGTINPATNVGNRGPLDQAMMRLVKNLAPYDPASALAIAKKSSSEVAWDMLLWAGSGQRDPAVRVAAYRDALTSGSQWRAVQSEAECLYFARQTGDTAFANEMRDRLPEAALSNIAFFSGDVCENAAHVTVAIGSEMPDLCRVLLEMALQQARDLNPGGENESARIQTAIQAMALIDPDRAIQIADGVRDNNGVAKSKVEIVRALLTPPAKWHNLINDPRF